MFIPCTTPVINVHQLQKFTYYSIVSCYEKRENNGCIALERDGTCDCVKVIFV
jgi:hypothetical protein